MNRFLAVLGADLKLMSRNGFVAAAVIVVATWSTALHFLPVAASDTWIPVALWLDMAIVGFFFMAAAVLYEKSQRTMTALVITPLRFREYLGAKVTLLTLLSLIGCVLVTLSSRGLDFDPFWLLLGVALTAIVTLLFSFATVIPFSSMSSYTIPANLYLGILQAALIPHFGLIDFPLLKLLPTYGGLQLIQGAFTPISLEQALFGLVSAVSWALLLALLSARLFRRYVLVRGDA